MVCESARAMRAAGGTSLCLCRAMAAAVAVAVAAGAGLGRLPARASLPPPSTAG